MNSVNYIGTAKRNRLKYIVVSNRHSSRSLLYPADRHFIVPNVEIACSDPLIVGSLLRYAPAVTLPLTH